MFRRQLSLATLLLCLSPVNRAEAAPLLRYQANQHGSFILIGNAQGYDCAMGVPAPVVGTVGNCGINTSDSAADVFVRSDDPNHTAFADISIDNSSARSTSQLMLPAGATVTYARLYWSAENIDTSVDSNVLIERPEGNALEVTADATWTQTMGAQFFYEASADVTAFVQALGSGPYRVSGINAVNLVNLSDNSSYIVWAMVVLYRNADMPMQNLAVFDGFDLVQNGNTYTGTITGFTVPANDYNATLGIVAYEGDNSLTGDTFSFNGTQLYNALNPVDNFLNGTHSGDGAAVSQLGDLPQLGGMPGSVSGLDLDVIDITAQVASGDTSATLMSTTTTDTYLFGVFITAISTLYPDLSNITKRMQNSAEVSAMRAGDQLHVSFAFSNTGSDTATDVVLQDVIGPGFDYIPNSLSVTSGAGAGAKTDAVGDDQADYDAASRTVTFRLGTGADAVSGGNVEVTDPAIAVAFDVAIDPAAVGMTLSNQGVVSCLGQQSQAAQPNATLFFSGNGVDANAPVVVTVQAAVDPNACSSDGCSVPVASEVATCMTDDDCGQGVLCISGKCLSSPDIERLAGGSLGCSDAGMRNLWPLLAILWSLGMRRRRHRLRLGGMLLAMLAWPAAAEARNEGFAVQRYVPSTLQDWTLRVERPWYRDAWRDVAVGLTLDYSRNPLIVTAVTPRDNIVAERNIIHHAFFGALQAATSWHDRLTALIEMPVLLAQSAQPFAGIVPTAAVAFADPRVGARVRIWNRPESDALSIHVAGDFWVPVRGKSTVGDRAPRGKISGLAAGILANRLVWTASVGMLIRPTAELTNLEALQPQTAGTELQLGAALGLTDVARTWQVGPEINYDSTVNQGHAFSSRASTLEGLLSAQVAIARTIRLGLGVGTALLREPGTPDLRFIARVGWQPATEAPAPDSDADGVPDALDRCPVEPRGVAPDPNLLGCPVRDSDKDGVLDVEDACPSTPAGPRPDPDRAGCPAPDVDKDGDGILDLDDACPEVPGAPSPDPKAHGCPKALASPPPEHLTVPPIRFELDEARLLPQSDMALKIVLEALERRADIRIFVEGHTDNTGSEAHNIDLSKRRARAVMQWLVAHHVNPTRLQSDGFGPRRPVADNATIEGRRTNRRVEFVVLTD